MVMEDARDAVKRKAVEQAKIAEDKLEERLAPGGFYHALAEFLVDVPLFPYAVMKGPTVRIKTQVKWTREALPLWSGVFERAPNPQEAQGATKRYYPGHAVNTPQSNQVAPRGQLHPGNGPRPGEWPRPGMAPSPQMGMPNGMPGLSLPNGRST